ncbi:MAG TPA: twin-arginine translocation signal domain-containing protein [Flavipsychrobacter sp.]|nr:twin-arginine translocation signal domain-containing protein [Flavipsychrobacter sp.]
MLNRRAFIRKASIGAGLALAGGFPLEALAAEPARKLTILHTNDTHSRLEPFPMNGVNIPDKAE